MRWLRHLLAARLCTGFFCARSNKLLILLNYPGCKDVFFLLTICLHDLL